MKMKYKRYVVLLAPALLAALVPAYSLLAACSHQQAKDTSAVIACNDCKGGSSCDGEKSPPPCSFTTATSAYTQCDCWYGANYDCKASGSVNAGKNYFYGNCRRYPEAPEMGCVCDATCDHMTVDV